MVPSNKDQRDIAMECDVDILQSRQACAPLAFSHV